MKTMNYFTASNKINYTVPKSLESSQNKMGKAVWTDYVKPFTVEALN